VGWNTRLVKGRWVPTFPQARYLFGRAEFDHWVHLRDSGGYHNIEHLRDAIDPIVAAELVDYVGTDYQLTDEVALFPTPGHTPGHVSVLIRSRGEEAVITGDLMHHPIQLADPSRQANFDMDKAQAALTRREFVERFANSKVRIIGSHFCDPTSGWIERHGSAWQLRTE
jgi:glyoxylase-like metal-dependent hydrolase (beta-lactamase superfamily II)